MRLRACLAKVLSACGVMLGPMRSIASSARSASVRARSRMAFNSATRSLSIGSERSATAILDRVVKPLEFGVCLGRTLAQFGDMRRSALRAFLAAIENGRQDLLEALWLPKAVLDVIGNERIELVHRHGAALAASLALAGLGGAGVIPVASSLPGP